MGSEMCIRDSRPREGLIKLLIAFTENKITDKIMKAAHEAEATGSTVITNARGEELKEAKTFFAVPGDATQSGSCLWKNI